jgi:hypothetical protein
MGAKVVILIRNKGLGIRDLAPVPLLEKKERGDCG